MNRRSFVLSIAAAGSQAIGGAWGAALDREGYDGESQDQGVPAATMLKSAPYNAPTPLGVVDVQTIRTTELKAMIDASEPPVVVDVRPMPDSCRGRAQATCSTDLTSLPTSLWLPGAGLGGSLHDDLQQKYADRLEQQTCGNRQTPIVFFGASKSDWLPINAALRAAAIGYRRVCWYRGGRAAWQVAGYPTTLVHFAGTLEPIALPVSTFCDEAADFGLPPAAVIRSETLEAPTPTSVLGARTLSTPDLWSMLLSPRPPVLVDVVGGSQTMTLPGAHWMRGAGRGTSTSDDVQARFAAELDRLSCGDRSTPIVIFCQSKTCWLSVNAAVRAVSMSYRQVYWYRGGRCAWQEGQLPTVPVNLLDRAERRCCTGTAGLDRRGFLGSGRR